MQLSHFLLIKCNTSYTHSLPSFRYSRQPYRNVTLLTLHLQYLMLAQHSLSLFRTMSLAKIAQSSGHSLNGSSPCFQTLYLYSYMLSSVFFTNYGTFPVKILIMCHVTSLNLTFILVDRKYLLAQWQQNTVYVDYWQYNVIS